MELSCPADILASYNDKGTKVTVSDTTLGVNFNDLLALFRDFFIYDLLLYLPIILVKPFLQNEKEHL